ncbi:hypothetical protein, partial [Lactiplantibacillus pentosus]|uniref:hypothetical protein n=1 Tax=Lactiplantibacillus pentosus TaxID=1589 RepID=UPI001CDAB9F2
HRTICPFVVHKNSVDGFYLSTLNIIDPLKGGLNRHNFSDNDNSRTVDSSMFEGVHSVRVVLVVI